MYSLLEIGRAVQRGLSICELVISAAIFLFSTGCGTDSSAQPAVDGELEVTRQATLQHADLNSALADGYVNERSFQ